MMARQRVDGRRSLSIPKAEVSLCQSPQAFTATDTDTTTAIFAFNVQSPETAAKSYSGWKTDKIDRNDLPQLRALSDLLWGLWNRDNADVKNIKYFFMIGIINVATNALMATALKKENAALNAWPGVKISMETDQGKAMLGKSAEECISDVTY